MFEREYHVLLADEEKIGTQSSSSCLKLIGPDVPKYIYICNINYNIMALVAMIPNSFVSINKILFDIYFKVDEAVTI